MHVPEVCLDRLRAAGLLVSSPFPSNHVAFPDGVIVANPVGIGGNSIDDTLQMSWGLDGPMLDAPGVYLHYEEPHWVVTSHDNVPGPGPGDFTSRWGRPEEAISDIISFFFGDPARMDAKRLGRLR